MSTPFSKPWTEGGQHTRLAGARSLSEQFEGEVDMEAVAAASAAFMAFTSSLVANLPLMRGRTSA